MNTSSMKLVVLDFDIPQLFNNKIFIPEEAVKVHHTVLPSCYLHQQALERGIEFITQDVFFNLEIKPKNVLMVSSLISPYTSKLISAGVKPTPLTCQESPYIASRFYLNLKKYSSWFAYSMVFGGMKKRLSKNTQYIPMYFPESFGISEYTEVPFEEKKFLTMISGNKRLSNWKKELIVKLWYGLSVKSIYSVRQDIINFYSKSTGFDLYGMGWDKGGVTQAETEAINSVYRGPVKEKTEVLRNYKFVFCFENAVFPGYVTEKIFDCLVSGSIPVYFGAPDIENFVPKDCFVNFADFKSIAELDAYLRSMDKNTYNSFRSNIKSYLGSDKYNETFSQEHYAKVVLDILEESFKLYA